VQTLNDAGDDDRQARFLAQFLPNQGRLRGFIRSCVWDRARCEDTFQEVSLLLWREFDKYDPTRPFAAWARGVAAKTILRGARDARHSSLAMSEATVAALENAFARFDAAPPRDEEALRQCLQALPDKSRALLRLRYQESLKLAEIASRTSSNVSAVHKALTRLRDALQKCVQRRLRAEMRTA
jgi:RNA polymerase sigma-70 factor, ECF subfamily